MTLWNIINPVCLWLHLFLCWMTENTVMTVRRYSTSSNLSGVTTSRPRIDAGGHNNSAWRRLQEELQQGEDVFSDKAEVQKVNARHSLQEYVHKNRCFQISASLRKICSQLDWLRCFFGGSNFL